MTSAVPARKLWCCSCSQTAFFSSKKFNGGLCQSDRSLFIDRLCESFKDYKVSETPRLVQVAVQRIDIILYHNEIFIVFEEKKINPEPDLSF